MRLERIASRSIRPNKQLTRLWYRLLTSLWLGGYRFSDLMIKGGRVSTPAELACQHFESWRRETAEQTNELAQFLSWFNTARNPQESYMSGWWDFSFHILRPRLIDLVAEPYDKTVLEIGYGAGWLLVPACHYFRYCIGVDIHPFRDKVDALVRARGVTNFELYRTDGRTIPLDDRTVDVIVHGPLLAAR